MRKRPAAHIFAVIALSAGLAVAALLPGRAAAATPCWKQVLNDWSKGRAIGVYPLHCYRDAIKNLPEDVRDYSNAADDISAALTATMPHPGLASQARCIRLPRTAARRIASCSETLPAATRSGSAARRSLRVIASGASAPIHGTQATS